MRPELRIRGEPATYDGGGILTDPKYGGARVQFRTGTRDQLPFDQSIGREGANAIAYRQGILISIENMPLRPFNGIIPFLGCEISGDRQPAIPGYSKSFLDVGSKRNGSARYAKGPLLLCPEPHVCWAVKRENDRCPQEPSKRRILRPSRSGSSAAKRNRGIRPPRQGLASPGRDPFDSANRD